VRILFLSSWFPCPSINGAKIRVNNLLRALGQKHDVTLVAFVNTLPWHEVENQARVLEHIYTRVIAIPSPPTDAIRSKLGYLSPFPRHLVARPSPAMEQAITRLVTEQEFDVVIASEVGAADGVSYYAAKMSSLKHIPKILDCLEIALYLDRKLTGTWTKRLRHELTWIKASGYLRWLLRRFDACTVPSTAEYENIRPLAPANLRLEILPHSLDLDYLGRDPNVRPTPNSLIYSGSLSYFPNKDAVQFFLCEILPTVRQVIPDIKFKVLGDTADFETDKWQHDPAVEFCGLFKDVRRPIRESWACIVPLRQGSGTRVKIIESMALGTPVIATRKGAQGLDVTPEENILVADDHAEFAAQTVRLLRDPALRKRLAENGRRLVEEKYDQRVIGEQFNQLVEAVALRRTGG